MGTPKVRRKSASAEAARVREALPVVPSSVLERVARALELGRRGRRLLALTPRATPSRRS